MAMFIRAKRVTDPLDDDAKARLRGDDILRTTSGYSTSGSEHDAADPSCLSSLLHAFFETADTSATVPSAAAADDDGTTESEDNAWSLTTLRDLLDPKGDPFRSRLLFDASEAAESLRHSGLGYRRAVMGKLRAAGYNAGLCKVRWEKTSGITAGSYKYIDVTSPDGERYIVDVDFAAEFEVARATEEYERVAAALPMVMVGTEEEVRRAVRVAAKAAGRSLKNRGLSVPPWRKGRYMLAKWMGPYRRTVNVVPALAGGVVLAGSEVKCRAIGFSAVVAGGFVVPPVGRSR